MVMSITYTEYIKVMAIKSFAYYLQPHILLGMGAGNKLLVSHIAVWREVSKIYGVLQEQHCASTICPHAGGSIDPRVAVRFASGINTSLHAHHKDRAKGYVASILHTASTHKCCICVYLFLTVQAKSTFCTAQFTGCRNANRYWFESSDTFCIHVKTIEAQCKDRFYTFSDLTLQLTGF